jgi:hypothetical protein
MFVKNGKFYSFDNLVDDFKEKYKEDLSDIDRIVEIR